MDFLKKEFKLNWLQIILIIIWTFFISILLVNNIKITWYNTSNISKNNINNNFESQYFTAKSWWNQLDICTMAKIVKTSYLQANDDKNYAKWMKIEKDECDKLIK